MPTVPKIINTKRKNKTTNDLSKVWFIKKYVYNTRRWRKTRNSKLLVNPLCENCLAKNKTKLASEIHHITPLSTASNIDELINLGFDYSNLQSLCTNCHDEIHIEINKK